VKQIHADQFFEWGRQVLDVPGRTIELRMLGLSIIMTDNPANVKTVLSTKVGIHMHIALSSQDTNIIRSSLRSARE
jgi:hypothetical protein